MLEFTPFPKVQLFRNITQHTHTEGKKSYLTLTTLLVVCKTAKKMRAMGVVTGKMTTGKFDTEVTCLLP